MTQGFFAISTSSKRSALHLIRASGTCLKELIEPFCIHKKRLVPISLLEQKPHYILLKNQEGETLDDVVLTYFKAPRSFTGEDMIEISSHGNPLISSLICQFLRRLGLRDAKPGEFTQTAFLHGKLDLIQAESIHDLICAENKSSLALIRKAADGHLSSVIQAIRDDLISVRCYLEAHIDFGPEDVGSYDPYHLTALCEESLASLKKLDASYDYGQKIKHGLKLVLLGEPNSGKSTLFNALLKSEEAIVTDIPGTTRDVLKDRIEIDGRDFILMDTAGIRTTEDFVEKIGIERSLKAANEADVCCFIVDSTNPSFLSQYQDFSYGILVFTKKDKGTTEEMQKLKKQYSLFKHVVFTGLKEGHYDLQELLEALKESYDHLIYGDESIEYDAVLISQREKDQVAEAIKCVEEAMTLISMKGFPESIASVLNFACDHLQDVTGEITIDSVYDRLFSSFCIGK